MEGKNIKQKRKIICLKGKIITEMLAAVTRDRHEQCYTSNPSLMTGLEDERQVFPALPDYQQTASLQSPAC